MGKKYSALRNEMRNQEIYYELTPAGIGLCAVAGIIAELIVLAGFGIQLTNVPLPVFGFLWLLFGILISGVLIGLEMLIGIAFGRDYRPVQPAAAKHTESAVCMYEWNVSEHSGLRKAS